MPRDVVGWRNIGKYRNRGKAGALIVYDLYDIVSVMTKAFTMIGLKRSYTHCLYTC